MKQHREQLQEFLDDTADYRAPRTTDRDPVLDVVVSSDGAPPAPLPSMQIHRRHMRRARAHLAHAGRRALQVLAFAVCIAWAVGATLLAPTVVAVSASFWLAFLGVIAILSVRPLK